MGNPMKTFTELLREEIDREGAGASPLLRQAPALYQLLVNLLQDPALPGRLRPLLMVAIAYFVLPQDILPEDLRDVEGLTDDIYLAAFVANRVLQETAAESLLADNWEGEGPVLQALGEILLRETELIGDQRDLYSGISATSTFADNWRTGKQPFIDGGELWQGRRGKVGSRRVASNSITGNGPELGP